MSPKCPLDFPVHHRFMSYRDVAVAKSRVTRPTSSCGRGGKGESDAPCSPVVPPSPEGKCPAPGPAATTTSTTVAVPGDAVSALDRLGRPPSGSGIADLSNVQDTFQAIWSL